MERFGVEFIESAEALEGCCYRDRSFVGQGSKKLRAFGASDQALAGIDDGFLGDVDEMSYPLNGTFELLLAEISSSYTSRTGMGRECAGCWDGCS